MSYLIRFPVRLIPALLAIAIGVGFGAGDARAAVDSAPESGDGPLQGFDLNICHEEVSEFLEQRFVESSEAHHASPKDRALEEAWREAAKMHVDYITRCIGVLEPAYAETMHAHGLHASDAGIHQDGEQIIDEGGMIWTPDGVIPAEPKNPGGPGVDGEGLDARDRVDFVTNGRKWGAGSPFVGGTNVEGPGIPAGTVTWSLMANGVDGSAEGAGIVNTAYSSLPGYSACFDTELQNAFDAWSAVANIDFLQVADNGVPWNQAGAIGDIRVGGHNLGGAGGVLAHAFFPPPNGASISGDVHFDDQDTWSCNGVGGFDVGIVGTHEIGHSIGLNHEATETAVMNAFYNASLTTLQPDDAEGAVTIYDPVIVINEVDYDQPGTDDAEFVELKNISTHSIDLTGWELRFLNGSSNTVYRTTALSGVVASGDYFVICADPSNLCNCDLDASPNTNYIQNGAPDAIAIFDDNDNFIDALSYEGTVGNTDYVEGTGNPAADVPPPGGSPDTFIGYSRVPDGDDNNANSTDFQLSCITPGTANTAANSSCADPCPVAAMVDIELSKTESIDPVVAGSGTGNLTYIVTATNNGPDSASGVVVSEVLTLPAGVTAASATPSAGTVMGMAPNLTWNIGNLANGASETLTVVLTVAANASPGSNVIGDTATVTAVNEIDTDTGNDTVTELTSIERVADIGLSKTESIDPVSRGSGTGNLTYVVTAENFGPSDEVDIFVFEDLTLPAGVTVDSITPSVGSVGGSSPNYFWSIPTLAVGDSATLTVVLTVDATTAEGTDTICDTAEVSEGGGPELLLGERGSGLLFDPNPNNDSVTECTSVVDTLVDIVVTKTESVDPVIAGTNNGSSNLIYVVTVENLGPSPATGVEISEVLTLPAGVTLESVLVSGTTLLNGSTPNFTWIIGNLGVNASETLTVELNVSASQAAGTDIIGDTASLIAVNEPQSDTTNDSATELTSVITQADMAITKLDTPDPVIAGNNVTYTIVATNDGPSDAQDVEINDALPAGTAFVSISPSFGANCSSPVAGATSGNISCVWPGATAPNAQRSITMVVRSCPDLACAARLSNTATVSTTTTDPNVENDSATANGEAQTQSSFTVTKDGDPVQALVGDNVTYTIMVTNNGPSNAVTPVLTDQLPPNFTFVDSRITGGTGSCSAIGQTVTCNLGTIGAPNQCNTGFGQVVTIEIDATVGSNEGTGLVAPGCIAGLVTNTATINSGNCLRDLGTLSDTAQTCTAPQPPILASADYSVIMPTITDATAIPLGMPGAPVAVDHEGTVTDSTDGVAVVDELLGLDMGPPLPELPVTILREPNAPDPCLTATVLTEIRATEAGNGDVRDIPGNPETVVTWANYFRVESCEVLFPVGGTCDFQDNVANFDYQMPAGETFRARVLLRFVGGLGNADIVGGDLCLNWDGLVNMFPDDIFVADDDQRCGPLEEVRIFCTPQVDPNRQLGGQVHLPILNFQGQDDVCRTWIEVQYIGCDPSKAVLVTWGEPGFCPPQAAGPLKVECTGLLNPGSTWNLLGAQIPTGAKSGILFKFTASMLSDVGLDVVLGFDDVVADLMCETLFFGVVGDSDDYRRFKKAYNLGIDFAGINQSIAKGEGILAVEVLRHCPGDVTPGVEVSSKYNGIAGTHLGLYDPVFGGYGYYVPLIYAEKAGLNTVMYIQNGGLECSSVEIWFKAQDDCLRARICEIFALAPGESYQWDASDCVGPDWQGSAWLRSSQVMGIAVDIFGRDILMTYVGEPQPYNYVMLNELGLEFGPETPSTGEKVAFGPLIYSEYQGWDTGVQVMNLSPVHNAKIKAYFLDRSGDIITTLVDWICPRGSQTYFLPVVADLPGGWVGSVRVESQVWWTPGTLEVEAADIVGVATLMSYSDVARTETQEAIAYNLLPEHKSYTWQIGYGPGGRYSGVGLIAIPSLLKDLDGTGTTSELAIMNLVTKPGFTDFAIYIYDQNGLLDFVCQKIHREQVEYIDLQTWGYVNKGFKGSAIISATFWEHDVFDGQGNFIRNLVGLGAVNIERTGTRYGEDIPGDEAAGSRGIPFARDGGLDACFGGFMPRCPGQPAQAPADGDCGPVLAQGLGGAIPDAGAGAFTEAVSADFVGSCEVSDVNLELDITHTFTADLDVTLSHAGVTREMFTDICGADDDIDITLDDDDPEGRGNIGVAASCAGVGPVGAGNTYATESGSGLDGFDGLSAGGDWRLDIVDDAGGDTGSVNSWSLVIDTVRR